MTKTGLDIGCGTVMATQTEKMFPGVNWQGIDRADFSRFYRIGSFRQHDLADWLPFKPESFDLIFCHHVLEHLPPTHPYLHRRSYYPVGAPEDFLVFVVNEMWRVLRVGGEAHLIVPWKEHTNAWRAPTHYRYFNYETFRWFDWRAMESEHEASGLWTKWEVTKCDVVDECHVYGVLKKLAWAPDELKKVLGPYAMDWTKEWLAANDIIHGPAAGECCGECPKDAP